VSFFFSPPVITGADDPPLSDTRIFPASLSRWREHSILKGRSHSDLMICLSHLIQILLGLGQCRVFTTERRISSELYRLFGSNQCRSGVFRGLSRFDNRLILCWVSFCSQLLLDMC
jgi:hypothetical protein